MSEYFEIHITSPQTSSHRRISPQWTLSYLRQRIELFTGVPPEYQQLLHFISSISTKPIDLNSKYSDNTIMSELNVSESSRIQVNDTRPIDEQFLEGTDEDTEFFELKDEDYDKLTDSVRHWKRENQLGRFNPNLMQSNLEQIFKEKKISESLTIGKRFRTFDKDGTNERRGVIEYIGLVSDIDAESTWVGVKFDEPVGKNDGSLKGNRYFQCKQNYGGFLKPSVVEMGDFEEIDIFAESTDDEI